MTKNKFVESTMKWAVKLLLVSAVVVILSLLMGALMQPLANAIGVMLGGALLLGVQIAFLEWARRLHKGSEDVLDIMVTGASVTAVVLAIGSFINLPIMQYSFSLTGGLGLVLMSFGTIILSSVVAQKLKM